MIVIEGRADDLEGRPVREEEPEAGAELVGHRMTAGLENLTPASIVPTMAPSREIGLLGLVTLREPSRRLPEVLPGMENDGRPEPSLGRIL